MPWTTDKPTTDGWAWYRETPESEAVPYNIINGKIDGKSLDEFMGEWWIEVSE